jgi:ABC-type multidrug transport system fused ATPase/permease subunit
VQTAIALLTLFIFGVATYYFHFFTKKKIFNLGQTRQIHEERRLNFLNQILGGIKEVKIYNTETEFVKNYLSTSNKVFKSDMWMNIINLSPKLWLELIAVFSLTILIFAMILQSDEQISIIATLALFAAAAFRLLPSINRAVNSVQKIKYYLPIINTLHGELRMINDTNINKTDQKISFSNNLILNKINFSYPDSKKKILDELDLNISKFSTIGLMGKTGSGKSTLANILIGLLNFNEGKIISDNIELKEKTINWGHKIGYVPQNIFLINDTIRRNIAFGIPENKIDNTKVINSLNLAQLNEMVNNFPEGLNTFVGERGVRLSGGQIQRIGIARALYHDPEFLVLDEATNALDVDTEKEFIKVVLKVSDKKTIFIISHRSSVLKFCDVVYKLEKGKLYNIKLN